MNLQTSKYKAYLKKNVFKIVNCPFFLNFLPTPTDSVIFRIIESKGFSVTHTHKFTFTQTQTSA